MRNLDSKLVVYLYTIVHCCKKRVGLNLGRLSYGRYIQRGGSGRDVCYGIGSWCLWKLVQLVDIVI